VAFGLAPALAATKADVAPSLKDGAAVELRAYRKFGMRNLLVVWQVAGSLMLLLVTGFVVLGFSKSTTINLGLDTNRLYLLTIDPARDGYSAEQTAALFDKLPERVRRAGAVGNAALTDTPPFSNMSATGSPLEAVGSMGDTSTILKGATRQSVGADYFAAMGIAVLQGREFNQHDIEGSTDKNAALPLVLNQAAAKGMFGNGDALGRRVTEKKQNYEVVGVVRDTQANLFSSAITPAIYMPLTHASLKRPAAGGITLVVNANASSDALEGVRREIAAIDPNLNIFRARSLNDQITETVSYLRISLSIYGAMGLFALVLASVGLAGVTAYSVARRSKEIGIRMALGANKSQVLRLVMREGGALVAVGTVLGFLGAFAMSKALSAVLNQLAQAMNSSVGNITLIAGAPLLLAGLAMIACYIPARRSMKIDPLNALRQD
jgi:predicted permease